MIYAAIVLLLGLAMIGVGLCIVNPSLMLIVVGSIVMVGSVYALNKLARMGGSGVPKGE